MPDLSAQSTDNQADEEWRRAVRFKREQNEKRKNLQEELNRGVEQAAEDVKKKLEEEEVGLKIKETRTAPGQPGHGQPSAGGGQRPARRGPRPPHADARQARGAAPAHTGKPPLGLVEPEAEEAREEAPREEEEAAAQPTMAPAETGGAFASPETTGEEADETPTAPSEAGSPTTKGEPPGGSAARPRRRYEPAVAAPAAPSRLGGRGGPIGNQANGAPTEEAATTTPGESGEENPEEKKPEAGQEKAPNEEAGREAGEADEAGNKGQSSETPGQEPEEKPYEQFSEPEPAAPSGGPGAPTEKGPGQRRIETEADAEKPPDAREADQEAQRQQATDLARQRQQTRQENKQKKVEEGEHKRKTAAEGKGEGFRDLQGVLYFAAIRDIFVIIFGFIPFVGNFVLGLFGLIMALPIIFFIKKQDKKRLTLFVTKELTPKWGIYAIGFALSHAITLIVLNWRYKSAKLIPGVPSPGGATKG